MATPQLSPEVQADLAALFLKLSHDPKTRKAIAKAVKEGAGDSPHAAAFKDVDLEDRFESFTREQEQRELKKQQDEVLANMNRKRAALLTGDGSGRQWSEDDVKAIEKTMEKYGITDYEAGATLHAATLPPVDPRPGEEPPQHGSTWEFPEWGKFGADPVKASRDTAHTVISEFMRKR
jgi:hypothetical protein